MSAGLPGLHPGLTQAIKALTEPLDLTREVLEALGETQEGPVHPVSHLKVPGDYEQQHSMPRRLIESSEGRPPRATGTEVVNDHIPQHRSAGPGIGDVEIGPRAGVFHASPSFDARPGAADTASVGEPGPGSGELPGPGTTTGGAR